MNTESLLFQLIRVAVCGEPLKEGTIAACTPEQLEAVYLMAKKHDIAHLLSRALESVALPASEALTKLKNTKMRAIFRYARIDYDYEQICQTLETGELAYIPLKGSVLRQYYPEAWMRTSCDIDILVQKQQVEKAMKLLEAQCGYQRKGKGSHDVSLFSPNGVHLELHYELIESFVSPEAQKILDSVWEKAKPKSEGSFQHVMPEDLFYFYHVAHMAKHVVNGGCGIRPILDLWIMRHKMQVSMDECRKNCITGKLLAFARASEKLSECWFSDAVWDMDSRNFENYILVGGVYGSYMNKACIEKIQPKKKSAYSLRRIVIPYEDIKCYYPVLEQKPWLLPVYQILRWFRLARKIIKLWKQKRNARPIENAEEMAMARLVQYLEIG